MFARSHLAANGPVDLTLRELQTTDISRLDAPSTTQSRTTHLLASLSFATIFFGTKHHVPEITQAGLISHGTTLHRLNRALLEPQCHEFDEIIVSVTTLAIQETLVPTGPNHFLNHMAGLEKLLALRDPRAYHSPRTIALYKCLRHMLLYAALGSGRPTILAQDAWKELLGQHCVTEGERHEQVLFDVLADCTVLAARRAGVEDRDGAGIQEIRVGAQALCTYLSGWRTQWAQNPGNGYTQVASDGEGAPTDLVFVNPGAALVLMLYNVALLNLFQILISLPERRATQELRQVAYSAVLDICRCLPGEGDRSGREELCASPVVHWAIQTARMMVQGDEAGEAKWLLARRPQEKDVK
jgi:hypothetical protein